MKVHELFAYLCVDNSEKAIEFYTKAFGAKEKFRLTEPSGRIGHAQLDIGGATLMLSDEFPECGIRGPLAFGGTSVAIPLCSTNYFQPKQPPETVAVLVSGQYVTHFSAVSFIARRASVFILRRPFCLHDSCLKTK